MTAHDASADEPIRFDTKIAVVLRDNLANWQSLNVTAFLVSGIAGTQPDVIGEPYVDGDDVAYLPMLRQPVVVLAADSATFAVVHERAVRRGIAMSIFTEDLFKTGNDRDNRAAVRSVATAELDLVGVGLYGPKNAIDKIVKGTSLHT
jgi:hypothetical protein